MSRQYYRRNHRRVRYKFPRQARPPRHCIRCHHLIRYTGSHRAASRCRCRAHMRCQHLQTPHRYARRSHRLGHYMSPQQGRQPPRGTRHHHRQHCILKRLVGGMRPRRRSRPRQGLRSLRLLNHRSRHRGHCKTQHLVRQPLRGIRHRHHQHCILLRQTLCRCQHPRSKLGLARRRSRRSCHRNRHRVHCRSLRSEGLPEHANHAHTVCVTNCYARATTGANTDGASRIHVRKPFIGGAVTIVIKAVTAFRCWLCCHRRAGDT